MKQELKVISMNLKMMYNILNASYLLIANIEVLVLEEIDLLVPLHIGC